AAPRAYIQIILPIGRQQASYRHALEISAKVDTPVFSDAGCSSTADASFVSLVGCQVDIVNSHERLRDEYIRTMQIKLWKQGHLQFAARCSVIEISAVRSDEQLRPEETRAFPAKLPGYISMLGFNPLDIHAVRQKKREPRLWRDLFRIRFVNLDFDLA